MKTLIDQLSQYADYHRDPRNILTHFVGVPLIMWAVVILLARLQWAAPLGDGLPVLAELGFALGLRREVQHAVEQRSGPVQRRAGGAHA